MAAASAMPAAAISEFDGLEADDGGGAANDQAQGHQEKAAHLVESVLKHI
jgi:hypothetical protein